MNRIGMWLLLTVLVGTSGGQAEASSVELDFNDDSAQGRLMVTLTADEYGESLLDTRFLYNDDEEVWLGTAGVAFLGSPGTVPGLALGVGAGLNVGEFDPVDEELVNIAVGGLLSFYPPALQGLGAGARVFYAPKIFSFEETERMFEGSVRLGYQFTPRLGIHVEFQKVRVDFEQYGWEDVDEELRFGFEARF